MITTFTSQEAELHAAVIRLGNASNTGLIDLGSSIARPYSPLASPRYTPNQYIVLKVTSPGVAEEGGVTSPPTETELRFTLADFQRIASAFTAFERQVRGVA